jgi:cytidine deaminase
MPSAPDRSVISAADAQARASRAGSTVEQLMVDLLPTAQALARPAISGFRVGAIAHGLSGALYFGANLEFVGQALSCSVHAEQAAVTNAWLHGEAGVTTIAVTTGPCGYCRQFLNELVTADRLRIVRDGVASEPLAALLPAAFGPHDLGVHGGLMERGAHGLVLEHPPADGAGEPTFEAALAAANASYAPYSLTYAGVALGLADGTVAVGRYAENAAFSPSLSPLQAALARLALTAVPYREIRRAVLVESGGAASQRGVTETLLAAVAPGIPLAYARAVPGPIRSATMQALEGLDSTDTSALS